MARQPTLLTNAFPYHVYARVNHKRHYPIPLNRVWFIYSEEVRKMEKKLGATVQSFVLMPNHFHMIVRTPNCNLDRCMKVFMQNSTTRILSQAGTINRLYGGRYRWNSVQTEIYYACLVRYVYQNPIRANLCTNVLQHDYSSIHEEHFLQKLDNEFSSLIPKTTKNNFYNWINHIPTKDFEEQMKKGLRRRVFKLPRQENKRAQSGAVFI